MEDFTLAALEIGGSLVLAVAVAREAFTALVRTKQNTSKLIANFGGKYVRYTNAGLSGKKPWPFETVAKEVDLTTQILDIKIGIRTVEQSTVQANSQTAPAARQQTASGTGADQDVTQSAIEQANGQLHYFVNVPVQVQFFVVDPIKASLLPDAVDPRQPSRRKDFMENRIRNVITAHFANKGLQQVYAERNQVAQEVKADLEQQLTDKYGLGVGTVTVDNPDLDSGLMDSIKQASVAGLRLATQRQNAEADRITRVANAQAEQAELIAKAEGQKAALLATAEGEGAIRIAQARAEKESRTLLGQGVAAEQTAIFDSLNDAMEKLAAKGIKPEQVMDYMQQTNNRQLAKQIAEAFAAAYGKIPNAVLFAGVPNPAHGEGVAGTSDIEQLMKGVMAAATAAAMRPDFAPRKDAAPEATNK
jgi:regulator of protease activity HflC (stomatin/prohibitin superfamily)